MSSARMTPLEFATLRSSATTFGTDPLSLSHKFSTTSLVDSAYYPERRLSGASTSSSRSFAPSFSSCTVEPLSLAPTPAPRILRSASSGSIGSLISPRVDLYALLNGRTRSPISREDFRNYLIAHEYGSESLDFWTSVEYLKSLSRGGKPQKAGNSQSSVPAFWIYGSRDPAGVLGSIITRFITAGSAQEINIDSQMRQKILAAYNTSACTWETLVPAQEHCYHLLRRNSLPHFLQHAGRNVSPSTMRVRKVIAAAWVALTVAFVVLCFAVPRFPRGVRWVATLPAAIAFVTTHTVFTRFCPLTGTLEWVRAWRDEAKCSRNGILDGGDQGSEFYGRRNRKYRTILSLTIALVFGVSFAAVIFAMPRVRPST